MSEQKVSQVTQAQVARDFDNVTGDYEAKINSAIAFAGMEHSFYIDIKREHILRLGREHFSDLKDLDVLDLGCGLGASIRVSRESSANCTASTFPRRASSLQRHDTRSCATRPLTASNCHILMDGSPSYSRFASCIMFRRRNGRGSLRRCFA